MVHIDLCSEWKNIILFKETKNGEQCEVWLKDGVILRNVSKFSDVLKDFEKFFSINLENNIRKFKRLYPFVREYFPLPLYKEFILIPLPAGRDTMVYLVKEHCLMFKKIKGRMGWSEIILSDTRRIEVSVETSQLKTVFECAEKIKRKMPLLYIVKRDSPRFWEKISNIAL